jgi:DNA-binding NarL/FixJ family response regulator
MLFEEQRWPDDSGGGMVAVLRILIADDHELVRRGIRALLEAEPNWSVIADVNDGQKALEEAQRLKPDIVILDISMPRLNGLEAARRIKKTLPEIKVLIVTMHDSENVAREVLESGARGYVTKAETARDLVTAVSALQKGKTFFTSRVDQLMLESFLQAGSGKKSSQPVTRDRLTSRQREIVQSLAEGKTNKEIAVLLNLSVKTVETHRANIMKRLGYHSVSDLVLYAIRNDIIHA